VRASYLLGAPVALHNMTQRVEREWNFHGGGSEHGLSSALFATKFQEAQLLETPVTKALAHGAALPDLARCQTSAAMHGAAASSCASTSKSASNSTQAMPLGSATSAPRATSAGGCVCSGDMRSRTAPS
jgi:hypothetical protein